jgi:hypothetical protein
MTAAAACLFTGLIVPGYAQRDDKQGEKQGGKPERAQPAQQQHAQQPKQQQEQPRAQQPPQQQRAEPNWSQAPTVSRPSNSVKNLNKRFKEKR